jgi:hypothetical protein
MNAIVVIRQNPMMLKVEEEVVVVAVEGSEAGAVETGAAVVEVAMEAAVVVAEVATEEDEGVADQTHTVTVNSDEVGHIKENILQVHRVASA